MRRYRIQIAVVGSEIDILDESEFVGAGFIQRRTSGKADRWYVVTSEHVPPPPSKTMASEVPR